MRYTTHYESPLGPMLLAGDGEFLSGLWFVGQKYFAAGLCGEPLVNDELPTFAAARAWLDDYFAGRRPASAGLPLAPAGSSFRRAVWDLLREIPYGETTTYGELARQLAARLGRSAMSAQAVGGAVGHNPLTLIVPCHRVVGTDGSLTGYAGGIERKRQLLGLEGVDMAGFYLPSQGTAL